MRTAIIGSMLIVAAASLQAQDKSRPAGATAPAAVAHESPFACDRLALAPAERTRHFDELGPMLHDMTAGVRELPDGYAFKFPADAKTVQVVAEWAAGEHLCCPFFDIDIRIDREGGPLWLNLTGRPGTKDFIKADLSRWMHK